MGNWLCYIGVALASPLALILYLTGVCVGVAFEVIMGYPPAVIEGGFHFWEFGLAMLVIGGTVFVPSLQSTVFGAFAVIYNSLMSK